MKQLPTPDKGRFQASRFVATYLADLCSDQSDGSPTIRGGQEAANKALAAFDVAGYHKSREEVYPIRSRSVSTLSPWVSHGLLSLEQLWDYVVDGPAEDVAAFRTNLLWQEYARHWYSRREPTPLNRRAGDATHHIDHSMGCIELTVDELEEDGWMPHEARRWFASDWVSRLGNNWQEGADYFQRHLIDGSEAANQLNWRLASASARQFSRWQVEERAPGLCASCERGTTCPVERWPQTPWNSSIADVQIESQRFASVQPDLLSGGGEPTAVWLHPQSLGDNDQALTAYPSLPAVFVFDEASLREKKFSSKKLIFWIETLAELSEKREVRLWRGERSKILSGENLAATAIPTLRWKQAAQPLEIAKLFPWRWLVTPTGGSVTTFAAWRESTGITNEFLLKQFATFAQELSYL